MDDDKLLDAIAGMTVPPVTRHEMRQVMGTEELYRVLADLLDLTESLEEQCEAERGDGLSVERMEAAGTLSRPIVRAQRVLRNHGMVSLKGRWLMVSETTRLTGGTIHTEEGGE